MKRMCILLCFFACGDIGASRTPMRGAENPGRLRAFGTAPDCQLFFDCKDKASLLGTLMFALARSPTVAFSPSMYRNTYIRPQAAFGDRTGPTGVRLSMRKYLKRQLPAVSMIDESVPGPNTQKEPELFWFVKTETFKPSLSFPQIRPHLEAHKIWVARLRDEGKSITSGYRVDADGKPGGGGLMFLAAIDLAAAERIVLDDPLVSNGCVDWQLNQWIPDVGDINLVDGGQWYAKRAEGK